MAEPEIAFGLSIDVYRDLRAVFQRYTEIDRVLIFGSRATGRYGPGSDIDLAVVAPTMSDARYTQLWNDIDALPLVFKIDLLHWNTLANPALKEKIAREGVEFFAHTAHA